MANAKSKRRRKRAGAIVVMVLVAVLAALWLSPYGQRLRGDTIAGTAYAARVACSCRFVAGRSMGDCAKDKLAGMALVRMSADEQAKAVTASVPILASDTARLREGYGCVLTAWGGRQRS